MAVNMTWESKFIKNGLVGELNKGANFQLISSKNVAEQKRLR